jgi:oligoendopeptidase F
MPRLPACQSSRRFVPAAAALDEPITVQALADALLERPLPDGVALDAWVLDWSEWESCLREEGARRYIAMTCDTTDPAAAAAFAVFVESIEPIVAQMSDKLRRRLVAHSQLHQIEQRYANWLRSVRNGIALFRPENVALETEVALAVQDYQKTTGAMSVEFDGQSRTLPQMAVYQESPDRQVRESAWRAVAARRLQDKDALDRHFDKLFDLRLRVAGNAGFADYVPYAFRAKERFDYTPADCAAFRDAVERLVTPRYRAWLDRRARDLGLARLRPWDLDCDPAGRPALAPYQHADELLAKTGTIFGRISPKFGELFQRMVGQGLIDPESRPGKAPGGYQIGLDESRVPFIFMNGAGTNSDVYTLLHEGGHSFHQFAMGQQPIIGFRDSPAEFAEVASMSMELIGSDCMDSFYGPADAARSRIEQLEGALRLLPWVAMVDGFQHWLYTHPQHSPAERNAAWLKLDERFAGQLDWTGLEDARAHQWQRQLHIFEIPFYYVEYGIAKLGALQVWANWRKDPQGTLDKLWNAWTLGYSRPLPELFQAAGIRFDFSAGTILPLVQLVEGELAALETIS